ncbi:MAG: hypothetical protein ABT940_13795, partial [Alphaproteobacteria bacterium]
MFFSSPGFMRGTLTALCFLMACGAANANTRTNGAPDYLKRMLKGEERGEPSSHLSEPAGDGRAEVSRVPSTPVRLASLVPIQTVVEPQRNASKSRVVIERIRRDDTYAELMQRQNIPKRLARLFALKAKPLFNLEQRLKTDTPVKLTFNQSNQLIGFGYPIDREVTLRISMDEQERITASLDKNRQPPPQPLPQPGMAEEKKEGPADTRNAERSADNEEIVLEDDALAETDDDDEESSPPIADSLSREFAGMAVTTREVTIRPGDSLGSLLSRRHIPNLTALQLSKAARPVY